MSDNWIVGLVIFGGLLSFVWTVCGRPGVDSRDHDDWPEGMA